MRRVAKYREYEGLKENERKFISLFTQSVMQRSAGRQVSACPAFIFVCLWLLSSFSVAPLNFCTIHRLIRFSFSSPFAVNHFFKNIHPQAPSYSQPVSYPFLFPLSNIFLSSLTLARTSAFPKFYLSTLLRISISNAFNSFLIIILISAPYDKMFRSKQFTNFFFNSKLILIHSRQIFLLNASLTVAILAFIVEHIPCL